MIRPIRSEARELFLESLGDSPRLLVTGAGGWFGSTVAAMVHNSGVPSMFLTNRPRDVDFGSGTVAAGAWDLESITDFAPTAVIDCAFVLRDYIPDMSVESYVYQNSSLTSRLLQLASLDSVKTVLSVSSGAAVHPSDAAASPMEDNPYGYLKRQAELALAALADQIGTRVVIARSWSLSGSLVSRPERYALSNMILQAQTGEISIQSNRPIRRRYVGVDDFFAVSLANAGAQPVTVDSGGELLEFSELADRIIATLGVDATVTRPELTGEGRDDYYPDNSSWLDACSAIGFEPATLNEQIQAVAANITSA